MDSLIIQGLGNRKNTAQLNGIKFYKCLKIGLLQANEVALNQMARALKHTLTIPGVKAVETRGTSVRA